MRLSNKVSVCRKDICVHADGKNGELIAVAFAIFTICLGIAAVSKAA